MHRELLQGCVIYVSLYFQNLTWHFEFGKLLIMAIEGWIYECFTLNTRVLIANDEVTHCQRTGSVTTLPDHYAPFSPLVHLTNVNILKSLSRVLLLYITRRLVNKHSGLECDQSAQEQVFCTVQLLRAK